MKFDFPLRQSDAPCPPKKQTFANADAAIANAVKLFKAGDISKEEFTGTVKKLQEGQLKEWLGKAYGGRQK